MAQLDVFVKEPFAVIGRVVGCITLKITVNRFPEPPQDYSGPITSEQIMSVRAPQ